MKAFDFFEKSILAIQCDSVHIKVLPRGFITPLVWCDSATITLNISMIKL